MTGPPTNRLSKARIATALDAAAIIVENGGTTLSASRAFQGLLGALGGDARAELLVRIDCVMAVASDRLLGMRPLQRFGTHLNRAEQAAGVVHQLSARRPVQLEDLAIELRRVRSAPAYSTHVTLLCVAVASSAFALLSGGDLRSALIAAVAGFAGKRAKDVLIERGILLSMSTLLSATFGALLAGMAVRLQLSAAAGPALLGSLMHLVPGVMLLNAVWDIATGRYLVMGIQRLVFASTLFLALGVALALGAFLARGGG